MATFNVNKTIDNGKGDTVGTLSYAILLANNTVGDDTIELKTDVRMTGRMQELISSNISIVGNNHILSGDANGNGTVDTGDVRPLFVLSGTVGINDLTIANSLAEGDQFGGAGMGGAVFIYDGAVSLNNVTLNNNKAVGGGDPRNSSFNSSFGVVGISHGINGADEIGTGSIQTAGNGNGGSGGFGGNGGNGTGGASSDLRGGNGTGGSGGFGGNGGNGTGGRGGNGGNGGNGNGGSGGFGGNGGIGTGGSGLGGFATGTGGIGGFGGSGGTGNGGSGYRATGTGGNGGFGGGGGGGSASGVEGKSTPGIAGFGGGYGITGSNGAGAGFGGAIFIRSGSLSLTNTTLTNNSAIGGVGYSGGGVRFLGNGQPTFR
jgi:hypothetical protein